MNKSGVRDSKRMSQGEMVKKRERNVSMQIEYN